MNQTHREAYPHQYEHEMCGRNVKIDEHEFTVYRVMSTGFGMMAVSKDDQKTGYLLSQLEEV